MRLSQKAKKISRIPLPPLIRGNPSKRISRCEKHHSCLSVLVPSENKLNMVNEVKSEKVMNVVKIQYRHFTSLLCAVTSENNLP